MPVIETDKDIAQFLQIEYKYITLFGAYHRDVMTFDNYYRFDIPKKSGGTRHIAAPKTQLKTAQRQILEKILEKAEISDLSHGFIKSKSVLTGAKAHKTSPDLLINIDLENFFPNHYI